jgi:hypothetical protein
MKHDNVINEVYDKNLHNREKIQDSNFFLEKLNILEKYSASIGGQKYSGVSDVCIVCKKHGNSSSVFSIENVTWESDIYHYIEHHDYKPSEKFVDFVYFYIPKNLKCSSNIYNKNCSFFVKLEKNQILILDALLVHGGYTQKYYDQHNNNFKYSEHSGLLDFFKHTLNAIIISGKTTRIESDDDDIYLPNDLSIMKNYEYIFHTHPPTPKAGGRANGGILYEFPSIDDIFHFIDNHNSNKIEGSLVLSSEGMYNVRKFNNNGKKIKIKDDSLYDAYNENNHDIQMNAINKYGHNFSELDFYSKIAQDKKYINMLNKILNEFDIHIDYYPRTQNSKKQWIIDTIYLPITVKK